MARSVTPRIETGGEYDLETRIHCSCVEVVSGRHCNLPAYLNRSGITLMLERMVCLNSISDPYNY